MGCLNAHDISVIVQSGQGFSGHVPKGFFRLLLTQKTSPAFKTVDSIHVKSGPPQRIQFHSFRVDVAIYPIFVCHVSAVLFCAANTSSFSAETTAWKSHCNSMIRGLYGRLYNGRSNGSPISPVSCSGIYRFVKAVIR